LVRQAIEQRGLNKEIKRIRLFGSCLHGKSREDSDVDLLVEFFPQSRIGFFRLINMQNEIEKFVGKKVDLQTPEALSKYFKDDIIKEAENIYEQ
jgi:predicted nucleotidyltransferase